MIGKFPDLPFEIPEIQPGLTEFMRIACSPEKTKRLPRISRSPDV